MSYLDLNKNKNLVSVYLFKVVYRRKIYFFAQKHAGVGIVNAAGWQPADITPAGCKPPPPEPVCGNFVGIWISRVRGYDL